jgi:F-type H+-transporting ATPase subunit delta
MSEQTNKIATVFDSEEQHVGEVYARALLSTAAKNREVDTVVDELESLVRDVLDRNPKLEAALANPKMQAEDKWALLDRVFGGKMNGTLLTFLKIVARRYRLNAIRAIQESASKLRDELAGRVQVEVTVSKPLDAAAEQALVAKLQGLFKKDVRLQTKVNPAILGGLVVRVGDTVYDGSVDGQLRLLRKSVGQRAENALRSIAGSLVQSS